MMNDSVLTRVAALKRTPTPELKQQWQQLFDTPPPRYNRRFLESRLAYRIQELDYGGLKPETIKRLEAMGQQFDGGNPVMRRIRTDDKPIAGTRLIREYQGVEHSVIVPAWRMSRRAGRAGGSLLDRPPIQRGECKFDAMVGSDSTAS